MKIINNLKNANVTLKDVKPGMVFTYFGNTYLMTDEKKERTLVCVELEHGNIVYLNPYEAVCICPAELILGEAEE